MGTLTPAKVYKTHFEHAQQRLCERLSLTFAETVSQGRPVVLSVLRLNGRNASAPAGTPADTTALSVTSMMEPSLKRA